MSICLHYRSYQVLTPHLASPDSGTRLSRGLINHIQAHLSPSLLVLLVCLYCILCRWPPIGLWHYWPQCLMSTWLSLLRLQLDSVWLLYDYVFSVSCNITIFVVICYLFLLHNSHFRNRFTWVSNCGSKWYNTSPFPGLLYNNLLVPRVFILGLIFWNDGYSLFSPGKKKVCSADTSGMRVRKAGRQAGRKGAEETTLFLIFVL